MAVKEIEIARALDMAIEDEAVTDTDNVNKIEMQRIYKRFTQVFNQLMDEADEGEDDE